MKKREFMTAAGLVASAALGIAPAAQAGGPRPASGPALLTVSGAIGRGNRGALDPALDQMLKKHGVKFDRAHSFDFAALSALPAVRIRPTLEYDGRPHLLSGPLLTEVAAAAGARPADGGGLLLRAVDGYAASLSWADARKYRYIVATHLDGQPMALGGLGPLWAVYDADSYAEAAARPLAERFVLCPWALYHIEVL